MIKRGYDWLSSRAPLPFIIFLFSFLSFFFFFFFFFIAPYESLRWQPQGLSTPAILNCKYTCRIGNNERKKKKKMKGGKKDIARLQLQISRSFIYNAGIITPRRLALLLNSCNYYPFRDRSPSSIANASQLNK